MINNTIFSEELKKKEDELKNSLDDINFYGKGRTKVPRYATLRIDIERSYN